MPGTLQEFLAASAEKAAADLKTALLALPEDKRNWSPQGNARTAIDMAAEVALNNEVTARLIQNKAWPADFDPEAHNRTQAALRDDWAAPEPLLQANTALVAKVIRAASDADLAITIPMPFGDAPVSEVMAYPYWNAKYHEGQINYIAALLGVSEDNK